MMEDVTVCAPVDGEIDGRMASGVNPRCGQSFI